MSDQIERETKCGTCGKTFGTNKDCNDCLRHLVEQGSADLDEAAAQKASVDAEVWLEKKRKLAPKMLLRQVGLLVRVIRDFFSGGYKEIPWATVASLAFAVTYAVIPIDLIPDFLLGVGFLDDLAVVGLVMMGLQNDLIRYCQAKGLSPEEYGLRSGEKSGPEDRDP